MALAMPPAVWVQADLAPRQTCGASSLDVGAPLPDLRAPGTTLYVASIAEIVDRRNIVVGWVYLARPPSRAYARTYLAAGPAMSATDLRSLGLSSTRDAVPFSPAVPTEDLRIRRCRDIHAGARSG